ARSKRAVAPPDVAVSATRSPLPRPHAQRDSSDGGAREQRALTLRGQTAATAANSYVSVEDSQRRGRMSSGPAEMLPPACALRRGVALRRARGWLAVRPGERSGKSGVDALEEPPDLAAFAVRHAVPQSRQQRFGVFGRAALHATPLGRQEDAART